MMPTMGAMGGVDPLALQAQMAHMAAAAGFPDVQAMMQVSTSSAVCCVLRALCCVLSICA